MAVEACRLHSWVPAVADTPWADRIVDSSPVPAAAAAAERQSIELIAQLASRLFGRIALPVLLVGRGVPC